MGLQTKCLASGDEHVKYTFGEHPTCTRVTRNTSPFLLHAEGRLQLSLNADVRTITFLFFIFMML